MDQRNKEVSAVETNTDFDVVDTLLATIEPDFLLESITQVFDTLSDPESTEDRLV